MTRTAPRAMSLENHIKKVPYEGRTSQTSDRARETRTALNKNVNEASKTLPWTRLISFYWKNNK